MRKRAAQRKCFARGGEESVCITGAQRRRGREEGRETISQPFVFKSQSIFDKHVYKMSESKDKNKDKFIVKQGRGD